MEGVRASKDRPGLASQLLHHLLEFYLSKLFKLWPSLTSSVSGNNNSNLGGRLGTMQTKRSGCVKC